MALPRARHDAFFRLLVSDPPGPISCRTTISSRGGCPARSGAPCGPCRGYGHRRRGGRDKLTYIIEQVSQPPERIKAALRRTGTAPETVENVMGTAAQIWMEQGRSEGKAAGVAVGNAVGKADTFQRLARLKCGRLSAERADQVRSASSEQLDSWLDALITAEDVDAVFGDRARR